MADFLNDFRSKLNRSRWLVFAIAFLYLALFALLLSSRIKANAEGLSWISAGQSRLALCFLQPIENAA